MASLQQSALARSRQRLSRTPGADALLDDLIDRWREPHRHYHVPAHIDACLTHAEALMGVLPPALEWAIWYHDAVYEARAGDNEARSAVLAESELDGLLDAPTIGEVARLVMLTAGHGAPAASDNTGAVMIDADLSILGSAPETYSQYAGDIRREYAHLDDETFRTGRSTFVAGMIERDRLFHTEMGIARWTEAARANLRRELEQLQQR